MVIDLSRSESEDMMRRAFALAKRGYGRTSPNPMVGAVLVLNGRVIGEGWHRKAGAAHAEVEAISQARLRGFRTAGSILFVSLEPCCTEGRTPPCTRAILDAGIRQVVAATTDPNPKHAGRGIQMLREAGVEVRTGLLAAVSDALNESFNHWIVRRTPFVIVKAAMTLDGRIASASGESKWITGLAARLVGMGLRQGADAILVGVNTVIADDPRLTSRDTSGRPVRGSRLRRFVLDTQGRIPHSSKVLNEALAPQTTVVVGAHASSEVVRRLSEIVRVWQLPEIEGKIDLKCLLNRMGDEGITQLLVEGGGEVLASFLGRGLAQRVAFFYAPKVLGSERALPGVGGRGASRAAELLKLASARWRRVGDDLYLTARVEESDVHWNC